MRTQLENIHMLVTWAWTSLTPETKEKKFLFLSVKAVILLEYHRMNLVMLMCSTSALTVLLTSIRIMPIKFLKVLFSRSYLPFKLVKLSLPLVINILPCVFSAWHDWISLIETLFLDLDTSVTGQQDLMIFLIICLSHCNFIWLLFLNHFYPYKHVQRLACIFS